MCNTSHHHAVVVVGDAAALFQPLRHGPTFDGCHEKPIVRFECLSETGPFRRFTTVLVTGLPMSFLTLSIAVPDNFAPRALQTGGLGTMGTFIIVRRRIVFRTPNQSGNLGWYLVGGNIKGLPLGTAKGCVIVVVGLERSLRVVVLIQQGCVATFLDEFYHNSPFFCGCTC
eukprot:scaffold2015_cov186-Amphora_coffeaeformis.AAC.4